jgi:hypothetical protein
MVLQGIGQTALDFAVAARGKDIFGGDGLGKGGVSGHDI